MTTVECVRVATWNVNSVKQRVPRLLPWLDQRKPDVVCLQETKLADDAFAIVGAVVIGLGVLSGNPALLGQYGWYGPVAVPEPAALPLFTLATALALRCRRDLPATRASANRCQLGAARGAGEPERGPRDPDRVLGADGHARQPPDAGAGRPLDRLDGGRRGRHGDRAGARERAAGGNGIPVAVRAEVLKDRVSDVDEFAEAVRRVAGGGTALDPTIVSQLLSRKRNDDPLANLTPREREVLELMAEGRSNNAIAEQLVVTERAVEKHVTNIFSKLDLVNTPEDHRRVLAVLAYLRT